MDISCGSETTAMARVLALLASSLTFFFQGNIRKVEEPLPKQTWKGGCEGHKGWALEGTVMHDSCLSLKTGECLSFWKHWKQIVCRCQNLQVLPQKFTWLHVRLFLGLFLMVDWGPAISAQGGATLISNFVSRVPVSWIAVTKLTSYLDFSLCLILLPWPPLHRLWSQALH